MHPILILDASGILARHGQSCQGDRTLAQWSDRTLTSYCSASGQSNIARCRIADSDRTKSRVFSVIIDRTLRTFGPLWTNFHVPRLFDLTLNSDYSTSDHLLDLESGQPVTLPVPSQNTRRVRSPCDQRIQLLFFTNFFSFPNVPTPQSVHRHVYVC